MPAEEAARLRNRAPDVFVASFRRCFFLLNFWCNKECRLGDASHGSLNSDRLALKAKSWALNPKDEKRPKRV